MGKIDYSFPLPAQKLISRYKPAFAKIRQGVSATIVSIPHLGHTSHMRFINSRSDILKELGLKNHVFIFVDRDKVTGGYETFASELLLSLNIKNANLPSVLSQNAYLLNRDIVLQTREVTRQKPLTIALVIEKKLAGVVSEIENLMLLIQKSAVDNPVSILWITDPKVIKNYKHIHPSSTFLVNPLFQKNFDYRETAYCLKRISILKGKEISKKILTDCLKLTGGFACTFHHFINSGEVATSDYVKTSLREIKAEVDLNPELVTKEGFKFLSKLDLSESEFGPFKFKTTPSAQEINLIRAFQEHVGNPLTREDIASVLWGKASVVKYSDWAIDKAISRLRKNIKTDNYKLITVKNLGYELIQL